LCGWGGKGGPGKGRKNGGRAKDARRVEKMVKKREEWIRKVWGQG